MLNPQIQAWEEVVARRRDIGSSSAYSLRAKERRKPKKLQLMQVAKTSITGFAING